MGGGPASRLGMGPLPVLPRLPADDFRGALFCLSKLAALEPLFQARLLAGSGGLLAAVHAHVSNPAMVAPLSGKQGYPGTALAGSYLLFRNIICINA